MYKESKEKKALYHKWTSMNVRATRGNNLLSFNEQKAKEQYEEGEQFFFSTFELDDEGKLKEEKNVNNGIYYNRGYHHAYKMAQTAFNDGVIYGKSDEEDKKIPSKYLSIKEIEEIIINKKRNEQIEIDEKEQTKIAKEVQEIFNEKASRYRLFFENGRASITKKKEK